MEQYLGWPVVTAESCFEVIRELGIRSWPKTQEPEPLDLFLSYATEAEREECHRFGPRSFVARHLDPRRRVPFNGFRTLFKPSAVVFALVDGMVPMTAEWKHGNNRVTIVPVAGVPGKKEADLSTLAERMRATAFREWEEETGTTLAYAIPLAPSYGIYSAVRPAEIRYFPFLGEVQRPIERGATKFDEDGDIAMVLFPLEEWLLLIENPDLWDANPEFGLEMCARDVTYAALRELGRLRLVP